MSPTIWGVGGLGHCCSTVLGDDVQCHMRLPCSAAYEPPLPSHAVAGTPYDPMLYLHAGSFSGMEEDGFVFDAPAVLAASPPPPPTTPPPPPIMRTPKIAASMRAPLPKTQGAMQLASSSSSASTSALDGTATGRATGRATGGATVDEEEEESEHHFLMPDPFLNKSPLEVPTKVPAWLSVSRAPSPSRLLSEVPRPHDFYEDGEKCMGTGLG
mmetsp:Transcript_75528/g.245614  ORF Transcript_75528/g.245614 Transcript_75528/m.245614 type:complete len:213 (-) Transcript_75528:274-912(-)